MEIKQTWNVLVGLFNRAGFLTIPQKQYSIAISMNLHVLYIDLGSLKELSSQYGHYRRDELLMDIAYILAG